MRLSTLILAFMVLATSAFADVVVKDVDEQSVLFAFTARSGTLAGGTLTLEAPSPVIFFTNRPKRTAGHVSLADFVSLWSSEAENSFKSDPPNAVISILNDSGNIQVVVELLETTLADGVIRCTIRPIQGELPRSFSDCSVFVDCDSIPGTLGVFGHMGGM